MTREDEARLDEITAALQRGETYAEIGARLGITRQRVEQLVKKHRLRVPTPSERSALRRAERERRWDDEWGERVRRAAEQATSIDDIAADLGQPDAEVARFLRARGLRPSGERPAAPRFSDEDLLIALQGAADAVGEPLTAAKYNGWAVGRVPELPTSQTIHNRFGGWVAACERAGVRAGEPRRPTYEQTWSREGCLDALRRWFDSHPRSTSLRAYDAMRATARAPGDWPSPATIRKRFDNSWAKAVRAAGD